jgi:hypothetical protein
MKRLAALAVFSAVSLWAQNPNCASGSIQIVNFTGTTGVAVAASGNQLIRVCKIYLTASAATNLALISAGSATAVSGTIQGATAWQAEQIDGAMRTKPAEALTITASTSATITGSIVYYREQP